ncbi:MAG: type II toxin-antitoxin system VapC family toxin [Thiothrix sp.]|nr:MAG: type II toxin-antitoxin system VapC family toxin [Thiothrix sp.]
MKALFDTNILIDYLNGIEAAKDEITRYSHIAISLVTWMEVLVGAKPEEEVVIRRFLSRFALIPLTTTIAERAVDIRRTTKIRLPDAIIRASAEVEHALLVSRNTKDFPENEPWVRVPYRL